MLLFIDNIFRFVRRAAGFHAAGTHATAVGYQPTLAGEMGALQERITSTRTGLLPPVQAVYVPADDLTDPAPATTFSHLDSTVLSRKIAEQGIYPWWTAGVHLPHSGAGHRGRGVYNIAWAVQSRCVSGATGYHRHSGYGRAQRRGQERLNTRARRISGSCPSPSVWRRSSARTGVFVPLHDAADLRRYCPARGRVSRGGVFQRGHH